MVDLMVLAAVVSAFGLVSRRTEGTILTAPLVFVAAGATLRQSGLVEFHLDGHVVLTLGEIALAIVLFADGEDGPRCAGEAGNSRGTDLCGRRIERRSR